MERYVILDPKNKSDQDDKNEKLNDRALSVLYNALALSEFNQCCKSRAIEFSGVLPKKL
jgi:hypothetical protein